MSREWDSRSWGPHQIRHCRTTIFDNLQEEHSLLTGYRPQRSCRKVMFLYLSVILFTGGGVCPSACLDTHTPGRHTPEQTSPWADTPLGRSSQWANNPPGQTPSCPVHAGIHMATAADGMHPTGIHSSL